MTQTANALCLHVQCWHVGKQKELSALVAEVATMISLHVYP